MEMERRIGPFVQLGKDIEKVCAQWNGEINSIPATWRKVIEKAKHENGWFSYENQINALKGIRLLLDEKAIREAIEPYCINLQKKNLKQWLLSWQAIFRPLTFSTLWR